MTIIITPNDSRTVAEATAPFIAKGYKLSGRVIGGEVVIVAKQSEQHLPG